MNTNIRSRSRAGKAALAALLLTLTAGLAACGADASTGTAYEDDTNVSVYAPAQAPIKDPSDGGGPTNYNSYAGEAYQESAAGSSEDMRSEYVAESSAASEPAQPSIDEKIIYSASVNLRSREFDTSLEKLQALIAEYGGFVENSRVGRSSVNYSANLGRSPRAADYTVRVPTDRFAAFTEDLSEVGYISYTQTSAENVTTWFTDTESRLRTYWTEEERLLEIMKRADTVEDLITIESRLSDIRYNIESLTSQLRNRQSEVDYGSVSLRIEETDAPLDFEGQGDYGQDIRDGFRRTAIGILNFFLGLIKYILILSPLVVLLAILTVVFIFVRRRVLKSRRTAPNRPEPKRAGRGADAKTPQTPPSETDADKKAERDGDADA